MIVTEIKNISLTMKEETFIRSETSYCLSFIKLSKKSCQFDRKITFSEWKQEGSSLSMMLQWLLNEESFLNRLFHYSEDLMYKFTSLF